MPTALSDSQLLERLQQGDEEAYETLHGRHADPLRRYLFRLVHDPAAADDLLQETFLRLWTRAAQWSDAGPVRSWLFSIARNLAFNHLDAQRRRRQQPLEITADDGADEDFTSPGWLVDRHTPAADVQLEQDEQRRLLRDAIDALPECKRQIFYMVHDGNMEIHEIAAELDLPEGTVKSRLFYARRQIAEAWRQLQNEWEDG